MRPRLLLPVALLAACAALMPASALGQARGASAVQTVRYENPRDGTELTASLALPEGPGPHRGVVLLSVAGTGPVVDRLVAGGYAVLAPVLRGFVEVEPLLRATYADLSGDVLAGLGYLADRPEVDGEALAVIAQADQGPMAMLAARESAWGFPLVLMGPPIFSGVETFRLQQRWLAQAAGYGRADLEALDAYVRGMADIVLGVDTPYVRQYRLEGLRAGAPVDLPPNAEFPADDEQARFFASPFWHDRLAFDPQEELPRSPSPVLLLIGLDDPYAPVDAYVAAAEAALSDPVSGDATVCPVPGRTRHAFTEASLGVVVEWLEARLGSGAGDDSVARPGGCLEEVDTAG